MSPDVSTSATIHEAAKSITVIVNVKGFRGFKTRLRLGMFVMRVAVWIIGCNIQFEE